VTTQYRTFGLVEFDTNSDSEKPYFSKTLGKYLARPKTIKCPKIKSSELLAGVDRVSRSIEGCIKLAETALSPSALQQNPNAPNPPQKRSGDTLSGIDRVNSKLANCIKVAESTLQNKEQKSGGGICGGAGETSPGLFGWDRLSLGYLRALHRNLLTLELQNQSSPSSFKTLTTS